MVIYKARHLKTDVFIAFQFIDAADKAIIGNAKHLSSLNTARPNEPGGPFGAFSGIGARHLSI